MDVAGDPAIDYTETHQVVVKVGYGLGPGIAGRLEANNIICNYQAIPSEEGFTAAGALRCGKSSLLNLKPAKTCDVSDRNKKPQITIGNCARGIFAAP